MEPAAAAAAAVAAAAAAAGDGGGGVAAFPNLKSDKVQIIRPGGDAECSTAIFSSNVVVQCRPDGHNHGSSKVKLINRIDYNWELRYYLGQLVAAHAALDVIAYAMKGKEGGMVRVLSQATNNRALIKNLKTDVRDVSFAFIKTEIILGCVDDEGGIYVYEIFDRPKEITYSLLLHVYHDGYDAPPANFRLVWCPYLPAADEDTEAAEESAKMFVFLNGSRAEVWDVPLTVAKFGGEPVSAADNPDAYVHVEHDMELIDAAYSSDGTAIATACVNGLVYFYQIDMVAAVKYKLLHEWKPHDGRPLSCLVFVDNILDYSSDSRFWKFAVTGANHNQEIKLWSCENWSCLQTIHFKADVSCIIPSVFLKIRIDYTGQHVVMCDINNKVLYVFKIERNDAEKMVAITMISEFLLPAPFLSYHILEASVSKMPVLGSEDDDLYCEDDFDEDTGLVDATNIKMLVIQPKKFQECEILFHPERLMSNANSETLPITCDTEEASVPKLDDLQTSVTLLIQKQTNQSQRLCSENFSTSSRQNSRPASERNSLDDSVSASNETAEKLNQTDVENLVDFERPQKDNFASAGSSPSREVQEILSLNNSRYSAQECFENVSKTVEAEPPQKPYSQAEEGYGEKTVPDMVWPKIPVVKDDELIENERNKFQSDFSDSKADDRLAIINYRLTSLENALRKQTSHIEQLSGDVKGGCQIKMDMIEATSKNLVQEVEVALSKQHLQTAKLLENLVNIQKNDEQKKLELFIANITDLLAKTVSENLKCVVVQEMKGTLAPLVRSMLESLKHQLDVQYSQKLQSTDAMLRENIAKLVNSKGVTETLGVAVVSAIAPSLEQCYRDMITASLIPSWEKVCSNMFQQINSTFTQGAKEYTASIESYMERQRKVQDKGRDLVGQMQSVSDVMKATSERLSAGVSAEMSKQLKAAFKANQEGLVAAVKEAVADQVRQGFKSQATVIEDSVMNAVRSRAVTPAPHMLDTQVQLSVVQAHLTKGSYAEAFQAALGAENLSLVILVCEKVDVHQFFEDGPPLPQNCLLALMQQLSVDLSKHTDLKLAYIRAGLMALAPDDRNIRPFMPKILLDLQKKLQLFMSSGPSVKHLTEARLLKIVVDSLLSSK